MLTSESTKERNVRQNVKRTCTLLTERHGKVNSSPLRTYRDRHRQTDSNYTRTDTDGYIDRYIRVVDTSSSTSANTVSEQVMTQTDRHTRNDIRVVNRENHLAQK